MRYFFITTLLLLPSLVLAQGATYTPLVNIPLPPSATSSFDAYINALYGLSISVAALLAVIKIIIAGVKWMMTDVVTSKGDAKKDIQGALVGLLVVLAAVLILFVINPQIGAVQLNFNNPGTVAPPPPASTAPITSCGTSSNVNPQCAVITCSAITGGYFSGIAACPAWCTANNGLLVTGNLWNTCYVPQHQQNIQVIDCSPYNDPNNAFSVTTFDCSTAISQCTSGNFIPTNATAGNSNSNPSGIQCFP